MQSLDLLFTVRSLLRKPAFTAGAVLSLALGIGANTAIFTCINALLLRPLPVAEPARLAMVYATSADSPGDLFGLSHPNYADLRDRNAVFSSMLAVRPVTLTLSGTDRPEALSGELVSGNYFSTLGVRLALGRTFLPEEDRTPGARPVVVLSHGLWQRRFNSDPQVIGRTVQLNRTAFTVVGVAPRGFRGLGTLGSPELWVPTMMHPQVLFGRIANWFDGRDKLMFNVVGRLRPGKSLEQAKLDLGLLSRRLEEEYPIDNKGVGVALVPLAQATFQRGLRASFVLASEVLMGLVGALLLLTCSNVANLLLARALERRKEIAIRLSIGAGRGRLVRQLLTEGLVLSLAGGALGLLVARLGRDLLWALRPPIVPADLDVSLDGRVLAFALLLSLATGVLLGLVPLLQAFRFELVTSLKGLDSPGAPGRFGPRQLLLVAQVALSFVLLAGAGSFLVSLRIAQRIDPGFATENIALAAFDLGAQRYSESAARQFERRLLEEVESLPGVRSASLAERVMLDLRGTARLKVAVDGQDARLKEPGPMVRINAVGPRYFETMGVKLRAGRGFTSEDREESRRVAVINETMARRFWPGRSPLGRSFHLEGEEAPLQVIGVAGDCKFESLAQAAQPYLYVPLLQHSSPAVTLHVRTTGDPAAVQAAVRRVVQSLDRNLPLVDQRSMTDILEQSLWASRTAAGLLSAFGLLALLLSTIGVYSLMAFAARSRHREMGIRLALGAQRSELLRKMVGEGIVLALSGVLLGCLAAALTVPRAAGLLFGAVEESPSIFLGAAALLLAIALVASFFPARQAIRADATRALLEDP
jgi:putative ABC transport system permease protein